MRKTEHLQFIYRFLLISIVSVLLILLATLSPCNVTINESLKEKKYFIACLMLLKLCLKCFATIYHVTFQIWFNKSFIFRIISLAGIRTRDFPVASRHAYRWAMMTWYIVAWLDQDRACFRKRGFWCYYLEIGSALGSLFIFILLSFFLFFLSFFLFLLLT